MAPLLSILKGLTASNKITRMLRLSLTGSCMPPYPLTFFLIPVAMSLSYKGQLPYFLEWTPFPPPKKNTHSIGHDRDLSNHDGNSTENVI